MLNTTEQQDKIMVDKFIVVRNNTIYKREGMVNLPSASHHVITINWHTREPLYATKGKPVWHEKLNKNTSHVMPEENNKNTCIRVGKQIKHKQVMQTPHVCTIEQSTNDLNTIKGSRRRSSLRNPLSTTHLTSIMNEYCKEKKNFYQLQSVQCPVI